MERNPSSHKSDPVIGVEHDPLIGRQEPEELSEEWVKLARRNVNEVPELKKERIARCGEVRQAAKQIEKETKCPTMIWICHLTYQEAK